MLLFNINIDLQKFKILIAKENIKMARIMQITIKFEDDNGKTVTKPINIKRNIPWIKEFDDVGFEEAFDNLETAVLEARKEASEKAIEGYLESMSKKN
jgi:hypothetical protein